MSTELLYKLPKNWTWTTLEKLGIVVSGGTPSTDEPQFWGEDVRWITPADLSGHQAKYISKGKRSLSLLGLNNSSASLLPKGSLVYSSRAPIGYIAITQNELATNQGFKNLIPAKSTYVDYLYYYLISAEQEIIGKARGTTFLELSAKAFSNIPVPLAPIAEQYRIVSKLDELLSDLKKGKEQLTIALNLLETYRQSVLQDAFINDKGNEIENNKNWSFRTLEQITSILGDGLHGTPEYSERGEYYFINGNNLSDGTIEIKERTKRVSEAEYEKYKKTLNENTILVSINGTIGNTAFYNGEKVILGKSACYFNVIEGINKHYVRYYLTSNNFKVYAEKMSTGSVIKNLGLKAMRDFLIPLPPSIEDQTEIVLEIDRQFSICDALEKTLKTHMQASEVLQKTLFAKAFEGKLTEQDTLEESSKILLERIKIEIEEYLETEKKTKKDNKAIQIKNNQMTAKLKNLLELVSESKEPVSTKHLWQSSVNKDNIDEFYAELKRHIEEGKIIETRKGKESFLQLSSNA